jgi:hypothetical protein
MFHPFGLSLSFGEAVSTAAIGLGTAGLALFFGRRLVTGAAAPVEDETDHVQVAFNRPLTPEERRTAPRRRGSCVAAHLADETDSEPVEVWVIDRSLGGLCLQAEIPVAVGSQLRVRPRHVSGHQIWTPVRVRACKQNREGWTIHCQFLQVPPMNVLLLYG